MAFYNRRHDVHICLLVARNLLKVVVPGPRNRHIHRRIHLCHRDFDLHVLLYRVVIGLDLSVTYSVDYDFRALHLHHAFVSGVY